MGRRKTCFPSPLSVRNLFGVTAKVISVAANANLKIKRPARMLPSNPAYYFVLDLEIERHQEHGFAAVMRSIGRRNERHGAFPREGQIETRPVLFLTSFWAVLRRKATCRSRKMFRETALVGRISGGRLIGRQRQAPSRSRSPFRAAKFIYQAISFSLCARPTRPWPRVLTSSTDLFRPLDTFGTKLSK